MSNFSVFVRKDKNDTQTK